MWRGGCSQQHAMADGTGSEDQGSNRTQLPSRVTQTTREGCGRIRNERLTNTHPVKTLRDIMFSDFLDPTPEQQKVVLIDSHTLHKAERFIESCEH